MALFGIDLGTTNSAISVYIGNDTSKIIQLDNGKTTMPSCIMYTRGGFVVGDEAYKNRHLPNVVYSAKRYMGTDKVFQLSKGEPDVAGIAMKPEEVGAEVIKGLIKGASYLYPEIKDVTITVPAEFNDLQRKATEKAGQLAGLNVVAIINEPTSAALVYETKKTKNIVVYDLGGGTFDVSVVAITAPQTSIDLESDGLNFAELGISLGDGNGVNVSNSCASYKILANAGDTKLGGDDIDDALLRVCLERLNKQIRSEGKYSKLKKELPKEVIEKLKLDITSVKPDICGSTDFAQAMLKVDCSSKGYGVLEVTLGYADFAKATMTVYKNTKLHTNTAIVGSGLPWDEISEIVLVGGSTKSGILQEFIKRDFEDTLAINSSINPDECVAIGASKQTAITLGQAETAITDVVPQSICVEAIRKELDGTHTPGRLEVLIPKNTPLPVSVRKVFGINAAGSQTIVKVYQGSGQYVEEATRIGDILIDNKATEQTTVTVVATINTNGVLELKVKQGEVMVEKQLSNVFGVASDTEPKKTTPRDKICDKYIRSLNSVYKRVPAKYIDMIEEFRLSGDRTKIEPVIKAIDSRTIEMEDTAIFEQVTAFKEQHEIGENSVTF